MEAQPVELKKNWSKNPNINLHSMKGTEMKRRDFLLIPMLFVFLLTSCSTISDISPGDQLEITNVSANLTLPTEMGAIYMVITNNSGQDELLLGASVPGCTTIELHEMRMEDDVMVMRPIEGGQITIPAGETVELKQGGMHVMCIGKTGEYKVGDSVPVTLEFINAGNIEVLAEVIPPGEKIGQ